MMPDFNAHDLDPLWVDPKAEEVQEFFDNLSEKYVRNEQLLIHDTTKEELDYMPPGRRRRCSPRRLAVPAPWRTKPTRPQRIKRSLGG